MNSLKNHFLISVPHLKDPFFEKSVVYLCEHDKTGAMGLIINKAIKKNNLTLKDSSSDIDLNKYLEENYLHIGGPVLTDRVLFLHTNNESSKSVPVSDEVSISGNIELLSSIQKSKGVKSNLIGLLALVKGLLWLKWVISRNQAVNGDSSSRPIRAHRR